MAIALDRVDTAPVADSDLDYQFLQWIWVLVDTLNEDLTDLETALNFLTAPNFTATQIVAMNTAGAFGDGILLYDTTNNEYVGRQSGSLVKFTTTAYP